MFKQRRWLTFSNKILNICFGLVVLIWHTWVYSDPEMVVIVIGLIFFLQFMYPIAGIEDVLNQLQLSILFTVLCFFIRSSLFPFPGLKHSQKNPKAVFFLRSAPPCAGLFMKYLWKTQSSKNVHIWDFSVSSLR